jgi:hypothetical protein
MGVWQSQDRLRVCATTTAAARHVPRPSHDKRHFDGRKKRASKIVHPMMATRAVLPMNLIACSLLKDCLEEGRSSKERSSKMAASLERSKGDLGPSITIGHINVKSHSGNMGRRRRGAILASRQRQAKEMIMTKYMRILLVAALSVAIASPAVARCGSPHAKTSRAAVAPKKPAIVGLRTAPTAQASTVEAAPSGLSTALLGG